MSQLELASSCLIFTEIEGARNLLWFGREGEDVPHFGFVKGNQVCSGFLLIQIYISSIPTPGVPQAVSDNETVPTYQNNKQVPTVILWLQYAINTASCVLKGTLPHSVLHLQLLPSSPATCCPRSYVDRKGFRVYRINLGTIVPRSYVYCTIGLYPITRIHT